MFARRSAWGIEENRLARMARQRRAAGDLCDLTVSNPTRCGFVYPPIELEQRSEYRPEPLGLASAREAIAGYYAERGVAVSPEQIVVTASTSEAYSHLFKLLCDAGNSVAMPTPGYPLFEMLAQAHDVRLAAAPMFYDDGWHLDTAAMERGAKAVLLVHPNNPTGSYLKPGEWDALTARGVPLVVDEVFYDFALPPGKPVGLDYTRSPVLTFVLNGMSKIAALPQMKLAWIVVFGPAAARREALARLEVINDLYLSASTPIQLAAGAMFAARRALQPQVLERLAANLRRAQAALGTSVPRVEGGWSAVLRLPRVMSDEEWAERLLETHGVLVHPGHFYGFAAEAHAVVSLLPPLETFAEGVRRIQDAQDAALGS